MPDDQPYIPQRDPERIDLATIKTDLEFVMSTPGATCRLPRRSGEGACVMKRSFALGCLTDL
jgi:hypothetical protein